jgi:protein involved in polysaccharide export with SLBB domain
MILKNTSSVYFIALFIFLFASNKCILGSPVCIADTAGDNLSSLQTSELDPDQYMIGPGDKFYISIKGVEFTDLNTVVNVESALIISKAGIVDLKGKTLNQAKNEIRKKIMSLYKNVEISISLTEFKKIRINMTGEIKKPSPDSTSASNHISDALLKCGGLNADADLRNIELKRIDGTIQHFDYTAFLRFSRKEDNLILREGDIITVNKMDRSVSVLGAVFYPAVYGFKSGESVNDIIALAGGYLDKAKRDTVELISFDSDGKNLESRFIVPEKNGNILISKGDKIIVREISEIYMDRLVTIKGRVKYSGVYKIKKNKTKLSEVVAQAGGFLDAASLSDSYIIRHTGLSEADPEAERIKLIPRADMSDDEYDYIKAKSRLSKGKMIVDFNKLFAENQAGEDVILKDGDEIIIPEKMTYITVAGQVEKPGNIVYKEGLGVDNYIKIAGGFSWRALKRDVRVIKANTNEWVEADDVTSLNPGDVILVPEDTPAPKFWDIFTKSLNIVGQVATVIAATVAVIVSTRK